MTRGPSEPEPKCTECGAALGGRYCSECGHDSSWKPRPLGESLAELWDEFLALDARFIKTLARLVAHPGRLSTEYLAGLRRRVTSPLRLYLALGFFASLITRGFASDRSIGVVERSLSGAHFLRWIVEIMSASTDIELRPEFNDFAAAAGPWIGLLVFSPLLGSSLSLVFRKDDRLYVEHFIVAVHFQAFVLFVVTLEAALLLFVPPGPPAVTTSLLFVIAVLLYSAVLLRTFYGVTMRRLAGTLIKTAWFFFGGVMAVVLVVYVVALLAIEAIWR